MSQKHSGMTKKSKKSVSAADSEEEEEEDDDALFGMCSCAVMQFLYYHTLPFSETVQIPARFFFWGLYI